MGTASIFRVYGDLLVSGSYDKHFGENFPRKSKRFGFLEISSSGLGVSKKTSTGLRILGSNHKRNSLLMEASKECQIQELMDRESKMKEEKVQDDLGSDLFDELKQRFLHFKKHNYMVNPDHYQTLSQAQSPKFMVVACADSRVCPSNILGFRPGEAFTIRNIANLVPRLNACFDVINILLQHGPSETSAALEFSVNSLKVPNILVVGHSCCGGIQALMSMKKQDDSRGFIRAWVSIAKNTRLSTEAACGDLTFEEQCRHCEQESVNSSLLNLLTYPWIEKRVREGTLSLHGGYYNFIDCTFQKWSLSLKEGQEGSSKYAFKDHAIWS